MIVFFRSEARATSLTTFSDSVELGEMERSINLHSRIAPTISRLHIVATSIPAWSIHTDTPAPRSRLTKSITRSRSLAA